ncbi:MAG: CtsR family transcriptional regulator, partial [Gracilibacteraceae bacterium]|nr:CtsR family transcriptional regulator [Gracilibacteraceae bacterium]
NNLLENLCEEDILTEREAILLKSVFADKIIGEFLSNTYAPRLRAKMMKEVLIGISRADLES